MELADWPPLSFRTEASKSHKTPSMSQKMWNPWPGVVEAAREVLRFVAFGVLLVNPNAGRLALLVIIKPSIDWGRDTNSSWIRNETWRIVDVKKELLFLVTAANSSAFFFLFSRLVGIQHSVKKVRIRISLLSERYKQEQ